MAAPRGRTGRAAGLGTKVTTVTMSDDDYRWLEELSAARMCTKSYIISEAIACYREALDVEMRRLEREERAARREAARALGGDVEL